MHCIAGAFLFYPLVSPRRHYGSCCVRVTHFPTGDIPLHFPVFMMGLTRDGSVIPFCFSSLVHGSGVEVASSALEWRIRAWWGSGGQEVFDVWPSFTAWGGRAGFRGWVWDRGFLGDIWGWCTYAGVYARWDKIITRTWSIPLPSVTSALQAQAARTRQANQNQFIEQSVTNLRVDCRSMTPSISNAIFRPFVNLFTGVYSDMKDRLDASPPELAWNDQRNSFPSRLLQKKQIS